MDIINQFYRSVRKDENIRGRLYRTPVPAIVCMDGFHISVQASEFSYCDPRVTDDIEYFQFECGFPSEPVPELREWKDGGDGEDDTQCVYGYVPVEVIVGLVAKHGGIKGHFVHFQPEVAPPAHDGEETR